jgi:methylated-DNA-[protein]-cysteine S-methyltransferase
MGIRNVQKRKVMEGLKDNQPRLLYSIFKTSIGWCGVVIGKKELKRIFIGYKNSHQLSRDITREFGNTLTKKPSPGELIKKINLYCSGKKTSFDGFKIDWTSLTSFQSKVLRAAMKIPYGTVSTYGKLAKAIRHPNSSRAVGNALSKNPFPIIVPCHRIVRGNGKVGGFSAGGGIKLKEKLLRMEQEK